MNKIFLKTLKIVPNSSRNEVVMEEDFIKIKLTAPPVENKANKVLVEFLAKKLGIAKSKIKIVRGETSKIKTLEFEEIDEEYFLKKLGGQVQTHERLK